MGGEARLSPEVSPRPFRDTWEDYIQNTKQKSLRYEDDLLKTQDFAMITSITIAIKFTLHYSILRIKPNLV